MHVFLIPVGAQRYELYYENPEGAVADHHATGMRAKLHAMLAEADERRRNPHATVAPAGWVARTKHWVLAWMSERIAEQRLLWHLRRQTVANVLYPSDVGEADAHRIVRAVLQRDADRHLRGLVLNAIGLVPCAFLIPLPGPNVIGYYFLFMVVSNVLSLRGARQGLRRTTWAALPSDPLAELRHATTLDPPTRTARVRDIAARLQLQHLATFVERVAALPGA